MGNSINILNSNIDRYLHHKMSGHKTNEHEKQIYAERDLITAELTDLCMDYAKAVVNCIGIEQPLHIRHQIDEALTRLAANVSKTT